MYLYVRACWYVFFFFARAVFKDFLFFPPSRLFSAMLFTPNLDIQPLSRITLLEIDCKVYSFENRKRKL